MGCRGRCTLARWRRRDGQALVETALVLPLLILLLVGIAEVGWLISQLLVLQHGAYELTRLATVNATDAELLERARVHAQTVVGPSFTDGFCSGPGSGTLCVVFTGDTESLRLQVSPAAADRKQGDLIRTTWTWEYRPIFVGWVLPASTMTVHATGRAELPLE